MPIYITQGRYTQQAMSGLVQNPEDRYEEVRGLFERAGCKLLSYYLTFGEYDFIVTYEAPSQITVMSVLATVGAGGGVTGSRTVTAISTAEAKQAFELAKAAAGKFRSAGT
ncbi:MAG: GYD domain-containing protein [Devosia sp.]|nr:GYD domain-containing protein [Devosia sp.]